MLEVPWFEISGMKKGINLKKKMQKIIFFGSGFKPPTPCLQIMLHIARLRS